MTRLSICLSLTVALSSGASFAAPAKPAAEGDKAKAPSGPAAEMEKLKGAYKWGMTPDEVVAKVQDNVRAGFDERLKKTANDPTRQDRIRKEMALEVDRVKGKVIKFDGNKTGYDVSIVDQEFLHNTNESMLVAKEENGTRYFFFADDRLYKMFIAFDKEMLQGKSFREFGQLMQARFGKAREVNVEDRTKAGVKVRLDHFVWGGKGQPDMLRLVDRSEFYDVFCLVIYDAKTAARQDEIRKARGAPVKRDNLVEAVTTQSSNNLDPNDNVLDQITGKKVYKPGEQQAADVVVPSPTAPVRGPTPAEVNRRDNRDNADKPVPEAAEKPKKSKKGGKDDPTKGLEL
ncbi:MAG TPA: hypothetical protein VGF45_04095 [Polyangia bacterium]